MEDTGDYINSAHRSEVSFSVRISSRSSSPLEAHQFCNFESSSRLEVLRVPKFCTFGRASRFEASLHIFVTLAAIVAYNEIMGECRLGFDNLHNTEAPPENLPSDYVMVEYTCPCGDFTTQTPLHYLLLLHLMGELGREISGPRTRQHLQRLAIMQACAIVEIHRAETKDKNVNEDEDDAEESADR